MNTATLEFTEQEVRNLLLFLDRVQVKGIQEGIVFMGLVHKLDGAFLEKPKNVEE